MQHPLAVHGIEARHSQWLLPSSTFVQSQVSQRIIFSVALSANLIELRASTLIRALVERRQKEKQFCVCFICLAASCGARHAALNGTAQETRDSIPRWLSRLGLIGIQEASRVKSSRTTSWRAGLEWRADKLLLGQFALTSQLAGTRLAWKAVLPRRACVTHMESLVTIANYMFVKMKKRGVRLPLVVTRPASLTD